MYKAYLPNRFRHVSCNMQPTLICSYILLNKLQLLITEMVCVLYVSTLQPLQLQQLLLTGPNTTIGSAFLKPVLRKPSTEFVEQTQQKWNFLVVAVGNFHSPGDKISRWAVGNFCSRGTEIPSGLSGIFVSRGTKELHISSLTYLSLTP